MNKGMFAKTAAAVCASFVILGSLGSGLAEASTPDVSVGLSPLIVVLTGDTSMCPEDDQWGSACP
ncbi:MULTISPECIES: hypothetical protein [unclassified Streptomyces]|uniref:hypothetical protein n=1 Tax=unclassified Streptomyces TaxID=2593676 RepID=UPI000B03B464|nr:MULTISPECIES: hypothetical protein [unclassified Streptomyces]MCX5269229.1 hypothetical protein [Streptomyces sp. NBC_00199]MCX5269761.1 hypothetical protein [Streptomyces sp. NBC_00199]